MIIGILSAKKLLKKRIENKKILKIKIIFRIIFI